MSLPIDGPSIRPDASSAIPAISLRAVRKQFDAVTAVDSVDLDIADGEFFSMLGPSGSGKTTMLRMIAGFELPTSGTIELHGADVTRLAPFDRDVNTVFQDYALFPHMTVAANVGYGLMVKKVPKAQRAAQVEAALASVRLADFAGRRPSQLSGGQRQRVALARALVNRPRVLLLDEPLGALDLKLREEMQVELKTIQREVGITFVFVTHDQGEALTMSDRIAVFNRGRIEQVGTPRELYESPTTEFVAGFVGTSNILSGDAADALLGAPITVTIRPEKIMLTPTATGVAQTTPPGAAGDTTHRHVGGTVADAQYLGSEIRYIVSLAPAIASATASAPGSAGISSARLTVSVPNAGSVQLPVGTAVDLRWPREAECRLHPTSEAAPATSASTPTTPITVQ